MPARSVRFAATLCAVLAFGTACSTRGTSSNVPSVQNERRAPAAATAFGTDLVAIDAGGPATGGFAADDYYGSGTRATTHANAIDTSAIANPAPQEVYQSERLGTTIAYTIPGVTAGGAYAVRLSFAETYWTLAGKRVFNVAIDGTQVLANFDIFAAAGGENKAIAETFTTTAAANGTISIVFTALADNAAVSAIEVATAGAATAPPTSAPAASVDIDAGGGVSGAFVADTDYAGSGTRASATTTAIDTSGVTNPAPQAVYQSMRLGKTVTYTIPGLTPGGAYGVRLDFAEIYWTAAGDRVFDASIDGNRVLTNFDVFAAAGAKDRAVAESFAATATSAGTIVISLVAVTDNAAINGIEITAGSGGVVPTPTPVPTSASATFNDYTTFGYDDQRDVYDPNSTALTPSSLPNLHLAWQAKLGDFNTQTQPVLATEIPNHVGVLFAGGASGNVYAYDALTGALLWKRNTGQEQYTCESNDAIDFGVGGTVAYDPGSKSIYVVGNSNAAPNATGTNALYHLDAATGAVLGEVNFAPQAPGWKSLDFSHTSVTLANGYAYVGTGATCDISSWRGRVAAIAVPAMTLAQTFFTDWNPSAGQPWGGGGVWGWGGVSLDFNGNVLTGVGNTDNGETEHGSIVTPFVAAPEEYSGNGDALVQLSGNLSTVVAANHPIPPGKFTGASIDLDLNGTPVVFRPSGVGCDALAALQAKSGALYLYDTTRVASGPIAEYQLAPSSYADGFLGEPAYSPATGFLYAAVPSSNESLYPPGMIAIDPGCGSPSIAWHSAFGPDSYAPGSVLTPGKPRSAPAASAGGVVLVGTICSASGSTCGATAAAHKPLICCAPPDGTGGALWALDAKSGAVLNGGNPLVFTGGALRMPPTIDGEWVYVIDESGNLYGFTLDPKYPAISATPSVRNPRARTTLGLPE